MICSPEFPGVQSVHLFPGPVSSGSSPPPGTADAPGLQEGPRTWSRHQPCSKTFLPLDDGLFDMDGEQKLIMDYGLYIMPEYMYDRYSHKLYI